MMSTEVLYLKLLGIKQALNVQISIIEFRQECQFTNFRFQSTRLCLLIWTLNAILPGTVLVILAQVVLAQSCIWSCRESNDIQDVQISITEWSDKNANLQVLGSSPHSTLETVWENI